MRSLRVLISSPGETAEEQSVAQTVIERLSTRFGSVELLSTLQPDLPTHGDADWANQFTRRVKPTSTFACFTIVLDQDPFIILTP